VKTKFKSIVLAVCHAFGGVALLIASSTQAQNLFVSKFGNMGPATIAEITPGGQTTTFVNLVSVPSAEPYGLAFNSAGDLFVADSISGNIYEFTPTGTRSTFASGVSSVEGLAFDSAGNLFASQYCNWGNIYKFTSSGVRSTFATIGLGAAGLAFDSAGNLFAASGGSIGSIFEFTPGGVQSTFASGVSYPAGLAFNSAGDLFVSEDGGANSIIEITPSGVKSTFATGLKNPQGLAFDSAGNLYEADYGSSKINKFTPGGGKSTFVYESSPTFLAFQPVTELQGVATNGTFQLTVTMPSPYYSTIIQASTNLVNWVNIYTNTPPFTFTNSPATMCPHCYYRALLGP
jgi:sugar lactone lactonase YvrE